MNSNRNVDGNRLNVNGNNWNDNNNGYAFGMALATKNTSMTKTYNNLYGEIIDVDNLMLAWRRARKGKTKKHYVKEFESNLQENISLLHEELLVEIYSPESLITFILRDPKTRKISKSAFKDRIVHHALFNILNPLFDRTFIYDSCASRIGKGNLFALRRFYSFMKKVSRNGALKGIGNANLIKGHCLKADIKHYFDEVDHEILLKIIQKKITDKRVMNLIIKILKNSTQVRGGRTSSCKKEGYASWKSHQPILRQYLP